MFFLFPNQATCGRGGEEGVEARWEARQGKARKALHQRLESKPWLGMTHLREGSEAKEGEDVLFGC